MCLRRAPAVQSTQCWPLEELVVWLWVWQAARSWKICLLGSSSCPPAPLKLAMKCSSRHLAARYHHFACFMFPEKELASCVVSQRAWESQSEEIWHVSETHASITLLQAATLAVRAVPLHDAVNGDSLILSTCRRLKA